MLKDLMDIGAEFLGYVPREEVRRQLDERTNLGMQAVGEMASVAADVLEPVQNLAPGWEEKLDGALDVLDVLAAKCATPDTIPLISDAQRLLRDIRRG